MRLFLLLLLAPGLYAQTLGQFRIVDFSARPSVTVQSYDGATVTVTTSTPHGLSTGTAVYIYRPINYATDASEPGGLGNHGNRGRGYFIVTATGSTTFKLASEMYSGATAGIGNGVAAGDKIVPLTTYYLRQGPRVWLDGPVNKGAWSNSTAYKPLEMVSAPDGNSYEAIAGNSGQQPPNATYWKQIDPARAGPGTFTASVRDTSATGRANANNYAFTKAKGLVSTYWGGVHTYDYSNQLFFNGAFGAMAAWLWLATDSSTYLNQAQYLYSRAEDLASGSPACNEDPGQANCGNRGNRYDVDNSRVQTQIWAGGLSVLYETLSTAQKSALADRLLNDLDVSHNGIDSGDCVNDGFIGSNLGIMTVQKQVGTVAGGGLSALAGLQPGSVVLRIFPGTTANWQIVGRVKSIDSDTQITFETGQGLGQIASQTSPFTTDIQNNGQYWWYTHPFGYQGQKTCGVIWFEKHHGSSPRMIPGQESAYGTEYKNLVNMDDSPRQNKSIVALSAYIHVALLLGDSDIRAVRLGEQAINYYMTQTMAQEQKSRFSGFNGHGTQYGVDRVDTSAAGIAWVLKNSLTVTPPGILTGNYLKSIIGAYQYSVLLGKPLFVQPWTTGYWWGTGTLTSERLMDWGPPMMFTALLYPNDPLAPVAWDYLHNRRGDYGNGSMEGGWGSQFFASYAFPLYDPGATQTPATGLPLQRGLFGTDIDECIASGLYCRPDTGEAVAFSQTGWTSTDTQVEIRGGAALPTWDDDNYGEAGSFTIAQNNGTNTSFLLGGNGIGVSGLGSASSPSSGMYDGNSIMIWNDANHDLVDRQGSSYQFARMDRWAGNPTTGVADNSYAYARINYTPKVREASSGYSPASAVQKSFFLPGAGATNVTREVMHLKSGVNLPNYVVTYDSVQVGTPNQLRAYWHLESVTTSAVRHPEWVTFNNAAKSATLTVPGSGRLNLKALAVAGSSNPTVALQADNYAPASGWIMQGTTLKGGSWSGGVATVTMSANPFGAYALPTDGSASITISGATPGGYNGTWPVTGYNTAGPTVSFALASDPGPWASGGAVTYPAWCSYPTPFNPSGTCVGNYYREASGAIPGAVFPGTYRLESCASTDGRACDNQTNGEWLTVFQPSTDESGVMPALDQPSCTASGGNCTALEIQDASYPKVAAFARQGALVTSMSFATTHSGKAQYVVSGLAPGSYDVKVNGSRVASAVVSGGDTTLSFSSTSGAVSIGGSNGPALPPSVMIGGGSSLGGQAVVR